MTSIPYELILGFEFYLSLSICSAVILTAVGAILFAVFKIHSRHDYDDRKVAVMIVSIISGVVSLGLVLSIVIPYYGQRYEVSQAMEESFVAAADEVYGIPLNQDHVAELFEEAPHDAPLEGSVTWFGETTIMSDGSPAVIHLLWAGTEWQLTNPEGEQLERAS